MWGNERDYTRSVRVQIEDTEIRTEGDGCWYYIMTGLSDDLDGQLNASREGVASTGLILIRVGNVSPPKERR
jgi:hypothetical protein